MFNRKYIQTHEYLHLWYKGTLHLEHCGWMLLLFLEDAATARPAMPVDTGQVAPSTLAWPALTHRAPMPDNYLELPFLS